MGPLILLFFACTPLKPSDTLEAFWTSNTSLPPISFRLSSWLKKKIQSIAVSQSQDCSQTGTAQKIIIIKKKGCVCCWGWDPSQKSCRMFAEMGNWCWCLAQEAGQASSTVGKEMEEFCLGHSSAVVQDCAWNCSLQEHFLLAGGGLWSFNKKHFFSLHPLTSTSRENYRGPEGAGGNPLRMWLLELQKELCLLPTNVLMTLYTKYRFFFFSPVRKSSCYSRVLLD